MNSLRELAVSSFNRLTNTCLAAASRGINSEVARRAGERGRKFRWFTAEEAAVAEALANIVVPSDDETPGLDEVCVLGPPAIDALDRLVANSPQRQVLYSRGLLSFDRWALSEHGRRFAELPPEAQAAAFRSAERMYDEWTGGASAVTKAWRRLRAVAGAGHGLFFAAQLYPQIREDCLQVFYTSRVSWIWLEYDGPPMDAGYPGLAARRQEI